MTKLKDITKVMNIKPTNKKRQVAQDILNVLKTYAYSTEDKYVQFRIDNGSNGVINTVIKYIIDTYLND